MPSKTWLLWSCPHPRPVETHLSPYQLHTGCWWFWYKISRQGTCQPSPCSVTRTLHPWHWLGWQVILWYHPWLGLRKWYGWHIHTGYIKKLLHRFQHEGMKPQYSPYQCTPKQYGKDVQLPLPINDSPKLNKMVSHESNKKSVLFYTIHAELTLPF